MAEKSRLAGAEDGESLEGEALKEATRTLAKELQAKIEGAQRGVGSFSDHLFMELIARLEHLDDQQPWERSVAELSDSIGDLRAAFERLRLLLTRRRQGRFVDFEARAADPAAPSDVKSLDLLMSQGASDCMQWRGAPLFKTAYDFSIYSMLLWALKPRTIIELGSGSGASAIWLADLARTFDIEACVYSVDLQLPAVEHAGVRFLQGDCSAIDAVFDESFLRERAHPWLLIEDAHVNVYGVLRHFHPFIKPGDYVVVEDSGAKHEAIGAFLRERRGCYKVDTYYTDFFGRNVTCAQDSILVRVAGD
jgi:cephalosporin hydroxylase